MICWFSVDEIFYPLSTEETSPTPADSSHPPDNYDSSNHRGGEQTETEEPHNIISPTENQQIISSTENQQTEEIGGDQKGESTKDTVMIKEIETTKPRVKFVRDAYILRERKPTRTVLSTIRYDDSEHSYNVSIKGAIKTHGDIAKKALSRNAQASWESPPSIQ